MSKKFNYLISAPWLLSAAVVYCTIVAYASAASFKTAYLDYFHVDIRVVDYSPTIVDFMYLPVLIVLVTIAVVLIFVALSSILNWTVRFLHWFAKRHKMARLAHYTEDDVFTPSTIVINVIIILVSLLAILSVDYATKQGQASATDQVRFTTVRYTGGDVRKVLIYQSGGQGIFKTYNIKAKKFERSYEALDVAGGSFEVIEIRRSGSN